MNPSLEKKLDTVFSLYIRTKYSNGGVCTCYTCDTPIPINKTHNGHCFGRSNRGVRWDEKDCRPQCETCNCFDKEKDAVYREKLLEEIGESEFDTLRRKANTMTKITDYEGREMIAFYKQKLKEYEEA